MVDLGSTLRPQPGPQTRLLSSPAQLVVYGGQAGGGKTLGLLMDPIADAVAWGGFRGLLLRKTLKAIEAQGGPWDVASSIYPRLGATSRGFPHFEWTFPSGAKLRFAQIHDDGDLEAHQGAQYTWLGWDEGTQFSGKQFWYVSGRLRSPFGAPPPGVLLRNRVTCNPDPRSHLAKLIAWWIDQRTGLPIPERDGVIRWFARDGDKMHMGASPREVREMAPHLFVDAGSGAVHWRHVCTSLTFIRSTLADNAKLLEADPAYRARLANLDPVTRRQWMEGSWLTTAAGEYFQGPWFPRLTSTPSDVVRRVRYWDLAGSKRRRSDFTAGCLMALLADGRVVVEDVRNQKGTPAETEHLVASAARDDGPDVEVWIEEEKGAAGAILVDTWARTILRGLAVQSVPVGSENKEAKAKLPSSAAHRGHVAVLEREWTDDFVSQLQSFPDGAHDDMVDAFTGAWHRLATGADFAFASV